MLVELESCESFCRFLVEHLAGPREFHRPINKRHHRRAERSSKLGEFVFHFRWKLRMNCSLDQLALLQSSKLLRQHALRDAGDGVFQFGEAPDRPREKAVQNHDLPFAFEDRERRLNSLLALSNSKGDALRAEESTISSVTNKSVRMPIAHPILSLVSLARISGPVCLETGE